MQTVTRRQRRIAHPSPQIGIHAHSTVFLDLLVNKGLALLVAVSMTNSGHFWTTNTVYSWFRQKEVENFALSSPILGLMSVGLRARFCDFAVTYRGCGECVAAPIETTPSSWIIAQCPLCNGKNQCLPPDIYRGKLSMNLARKPASSAEAH
jgi:hypothetical protein